MKRIIIIILALSPVLLNLISCDDSIDTQQAYDFQVSTLPVQSDIHRDETVEIRCKLQREGYWNDACYYLRYFQSEGRGELRTDEGIVLLPNDNYPIEREEFRLYYTSCSEELQQIDLYFSDNFGTMQTLSLRFNNNSDEE